MQLSTTSVFLALLFCPAAAAQPDAGGTFSPPRVGQPEDFEELSGAVGVFEVSSEAAPLQVEVGKPVRLTIRFRAEGPVPRPPSRPKLERHADITARFYVEAPTPAEGRPNKDTWEFYYLLKPKISTVTAVPEMYCWVFHPAYGDNPLGYQKKFLDPIPIKVVAAVKSPPEVKGAAERPAFPDVVLGIVHGEKVLRRERPFRLPGLPVLALLLAPPLACVAWYLAWQRLYPDAARIARRKRSRAARVALRDLRRTGRLPHEERAVHVAEVVARFLRHRLALPAETPTPGEAAALLRESGAPESLQREAAALFEACDAARFSPNPPAAADLEGSAVRLVLAVESQPWASHTS